MKGILVKPDMIKAIREGRKTVTRRLDGLKKINQEPDKWEYLDGSSLPKLGRFTFYKEYPHSDFVIKSRYQVGEVVYIKEAYWEDSGDIYYKSDMQEGQIPTNMHFTEPVSKAKWKSPMFMPSWAARTFIKITDMRAEKLQEISREDVLAEGILFQDYKQDYQWAYAKIWDSINPKYPWASNSWVWVISFKGVR